MIVANGTSALDRWRALVETRRAQMDAAYARLGRTSADFWARRAGRFRQSNAAVDEQAPLVRRVLSLLPSGGTVLDVGAGAGRFALPIARGAGHVTALEPSEAMLAGLRDAATEHGLANVEALHAAWLESEAGIPAADVVLCAHVLYPHADLDRWIATLDAHARGAVVLESVASWADPAVLTDLWRRFHGDERVLQPALDHLYPALLELGVAANVEVYRAPTAMWRFASLDQAVEGAREHLIVPESPEIDAVLRPALVAALRPDGEALALPHERVVATLWWEQAGPRLARYPANPTDPRQRLDREPSSSG